MPQHNFIPAVIGCLSLFLLGGGCSMGLEKPSIFGGNSVEPSGELRTGIGQQTDEQTLLQLQERLQLAKQSGGMTEASYTEINGQLQVLEANGAVPLEIAELRTLLESIDVGGRSASPALPKKAAAVPEKTTDKLSVKTLSTSTPVKPPVPTTPPTPSPVSATTEHDTGDVKFSQPAPAVESSPNPTSLPLADEEKTNQPETKPTCVSDPSPVFTAHITDMSAVNYVVPPPTMGAGPSLKPHSYIGTDHARVPVYAPTALTLKSGSHYVGGPYMFDFAASCEVTVRFGHFTEPVDALKQLLPAEPKDDSRTQELPPLQFAAGELLGYTKGTSVAGNWDFGVYNATVRNRYDGDPEWGWSDINTTAVCPFQYFTAGLKSAYTAKFNATILGGNPPHGESFCGSE